MICLIKKDTGAMHPCLFIIFLYKPYNSMYNLHVVFK